MNKLQKLILLFGLLIIVVLAWKLFYYTPQKNIIVQNVNEYAGTISTSTNDQLVYTNNKIGLTFTFPLGWHVGDNNLGVGSLQLLNYDETGLVPPGFQKGMNKIEAVITSNTSSTPDTGDYPKETIKSTTVQMGKQNVVKEVTNYNDSANQQFVTYYIPVPSQLGKYLTISIFGDPANFAVLDNLVASINMTDWKTYQNNTYGFEAKYPDSYSEFHSSGGDSGIDVSTGKECESLLNTATNVFPLDCQYYSIYVMNVQKNSTPGSHGPGVVTYPITVAGIQGEKVVSPTGIGNWENMDQVVVWFQKGDNWYIQTFTFNHVKSQAAESVMNQILSSFRFTNSSQTAGCNTDSDCQNGASCMTEGPLIANQPVHKVCVPKGQAVPL